MVMVYGSTPLDSSFSMVHFCCASSGGLHFGQTMKSQIKTTKYDLSHKSIFLEIAINVIFINLVFIKEVTV